LPTLMPRRLVADPAAYQETFGGWYEGSWPPPAIVRAPRWGLPVPMDPARLEAVPPAPNVALDMLQAATPVQQ